MEPRCFDDDKRPVGMSEHVKTFWDFIDSRAIVRRIVLFATLWLTFRSFYWAAHFAEISTRTGLDVAAIIGAVTAPVSLLLSAVSKFYSESRG